MGPWLVLTNGECPCHFHPLFTHLLNIKLSPRALGWDGGFFEAETMGAMPRPAQSYRLCLSVGWALELEEETAPLAVSPRAPNFSSPLKAQPRRHPPRAEEAWNTVL